MALNTDLSWAHRTAKAILLIRVLVGWVFLSEGIQKFLFRFSDLPAFRRMRPILLLYY
jgi:uncharacterized membrane protein YphA (DoxX/SURF4 family)